MILFNFDKIIKKTMNIEKVIYSHSLIYMNY